MRITFKDEELRRLIELGRSRKYKKISKDNTFKRHLIEVYAILRTVDNTAELNSFSSLHYEKLKHIDLSSVRVMNGRVERLLFREIDNGIEIILIELNETHYGKKK